ncbi:MAG: OsmC family protein [Rikenellaceae bacterium]
MTIKTIYKGDLRTQATHIDSGAVVMTDAPKDNQGNGEAFSPTDMLAASLGSCMLTIAGIAARTHGFSIEGATAEITKIMSAEPRRVGEIVVRFTFPANGYSAKEKKIIEAAAHSCPVAKSLHPDTVQTITFNYL